MNGPKNESTGVSIHQTKEQTRLAERAIPRWPPAERRRSRPSQTRASQAKLLGLRPEEGGWRGGPGSRRWGGSDRRQGSAGDMWGSALSANRVHPIVRWRLTPVLSFFGPFQNNPNFNQN